MNFSRNRLMLPACVALAGALLLGGCNKRTLKWTCQDCGEIQSARIVALWELPAPAVSSSPMMQTGLVNEVTQAFMQRGWTVQTVTDPNAPTPEQVKEKYEQAKADPEGTERKLANQSPPPSRLQAARNAGADLLAEVAMQVFLRSSVQYEPRYYWTVGSYGPFYNVGPEPYWSAGAMDYPFYEPDSAEVSWYWEIKSVALRFSDVQNGQVLGVIILRYENETTDLEAAVKDVMLGVDALRQGKTSGEVTLDGDPGEWPEKDNDD
jgi:hypothetical protein